MYYIMYVSYRSSNNIRILTILNFISTRTQLYIIDRCAVQGQGQGPSHFGARIVTVWHTTVWYLLLRDFRFRCSCRDRVPSSSC